MTRVVTYSFLLQFVERLIYGVLLSYLLLRLNSVLWYKFVFSIL